MTDPYFYPGPKRIVAALKLAGFPDNSLVTMTAIHGAETSGNVWAVSIVNSNGTRDWGAFQLSAKTPPPNWANYFENARLVLPQYLSRGYQPWYGYLRINTQFGLSKHPTWTYLDWAKAGYVQYQAEVAKGYSVARIASSYFLEDGL